MEKVLNTRIALRIDTLENWLKTEVEGKGAKLVLKHGEIGLCEIPSGNKAATTAPTVLFKVGDGKTAFGSLNWASALAADVYSWAKAETVVLENEVINFKNGETVVHSIDLSKFALNSELTSAISALEAADLALGKRIDDVIAAAYDDTEVRGLISGIDSAYKAADQVLEGLVNTAQEAAENAQKEVDALEIVVSTLNGTVGSEVARVEGLLEDEADAREAADKAINDKLGGSFTSENTVAKAISDAQSAAEGKVSELANGVVQSNTNRIKSIEDDYLKAQDKSNLEAAIEANASAIEANTNKIGTDIAAAKSALEGYADTKAGVVQSSLDGHIDAYNTKVGELVAEDARIAELVATEKSRAEAAEAALQTAVATEKSRAEQVESNLQTAIDNINTNIASGLHFRGVVNSLEAVAEPKSGDICIIGNQEYIYNGTEWEELGNAEAHATVEYVNTELGKKVNQSAYEAKVADLEAEDVDIRADFAAADAALSSDLEGKIALRATQVDFNELRGRVDGHDTELAKKALASDLTDHINTFTSHRSAQEAKDLAQDEKIAAIENSLKDSGTIYELIEAAKAQADKGVADAKTAQDTVDELAEKVGTITGTSTLVEQLAAIKATAEAAAKASEVEASIAAINAEVAKKATIETVNGIDGRLSTAEGKIAAAEGNITTLQGKVTALEGTYTNAQVDKAIADAVATEKTRAEAAESALDQRIDAYDERFGTKDDILVFNCGSSTAVI